MHMYIFPVHVYAVCVMYVSEILMACETTTRDETPSYSPLTVFVQCCYALGAPHVPHSHQLIVPTGGKETAVWGERTAPHCPIVT